MMFKFWKFQIYWILVVKDDDFDAPAYSWYNFKLPKLVIRKSRIGFAWGQIGSHDYEIWYLRGESDD